MSSAILLILLLSPVSFAAGGGRLSSQPITYSAGVNASVKTDATVQNAIKSGSYEYTGFGAAESTIETTPDGTLIYAPAFSGNKTGYATSKDYGKTWSMVTPSPNQPRTQPVFEIHDGRYFYWSSSMPGLHMSYSDDEGKTWVNAAKHLQPLVQDWVKIVGGKPVSSQLESNASKILYMSGPSLISVPIELIRAEKHVLQADSAGDHRL
jgi:Neuraminidase (sialidase)